ncbi:hypothetical protein KY495_00350 [Massilia sp. PAMC28688]|uniref:hypothetical protein n=1 Tax=Massilia sp. PAMC28688 TaxID=2861283 RepID=UPI001C6392D0|nr:hypothetical protein [Massilia sp. PAMC28688]QYF93729.1 hypothetical protein KY495_00350 [Massilia sp. PAMC28688]
MSHAIENAEELFRFASARAAGAATVPAGVLELEDDQAVPQWLASAPEQDFGTRLQELENKWQALSGRPGLELQVDAQLAPGERAPFPAVTIFPGATAGDAGGRAGDLLTSLWQLYLQGISTGNADTAQLRRTQQLMGQAGLLKSAALAGSGLIAPEQLAAARHPVVRLPASFEQFMRSRRDEHRSATALASARQAQDSAATRARLTERLAQLGKLEQDLAAAIDQGGPVEIPAPVTLPQFAAEPGAERAFHFRPAADLSQRFREQNAALIEALNQAQIPSAGVSPYTLLDEVRRQMADLVLAEARLPAAPPAAQQAGSIGAFGVRPVGVTDLRVVRQVLVKYEKGELAHIDNVIDGEKRERHHSRLQRAEQGVTDYSDRSTEQWRESQSADRFEVSQWTYISARENQDSNSSINLSGTYGQVTVNGSTFANSGRGRDSARGEDLRRSREIINRALALTRQSVGQYRWRNVLSEVQETIIHKQHAKGNAHIKAQYRWVDKVYQAQVYNHGARAMYEIMVPAPAALFKYLLAQQPGIAPFAAPVPVRPTVTPAQINDTNWAALAAQYGVVLPPPPLAAITEFAQVTSSGFSLPDDVPLNLLRTSQGGTFERTQALERGYQAGSAGVSISWYGASGEGGVTASIGTLLFTSTVEGDTAIPPQQLNADTDAVPYSATAWGAVEQFTVNFYIVWTRTQRAVEQWQLASYQIIQEEYERKLAAYRAQVAEAVITEPHMRAIERAELKRAIIEIVRAGGAQPTPAPAVDLSGRPTIQVANLEAAAREVRFVEVAFEWEQMTYSFQPYFFGQESGWGAHNFVQQGDSVFTAFLNAGFASVILPVRKNFEHAAAVYLQTGVVLDIAVVPADDELVRMNCEVIEINAQGEAGVPEGEAWTYRVPTSLIVLDDGTNGPLPVMVEKAAEAPTPAP